jgi:hypothetical protein
VGAKLQKLCRLAVIIVSLLALKERNVATENPKRSIIGSFFAIKGKKIGLGAYYGCVTPRPHGLGQTRLERK